MGLDTVRLLIVVEKADYRAALADIFMPERLHEQLSGRISPVDIHIVTAAARWANEVQEVAVFSCRSEKAYSDRTYLKISLMGSGLSLPEAEYSAENGRELMRRVAEFCPTHLVMCVRALAISSWAVRNKIRTVALLSDWEEPMGFPERWRHSRLIRLLNHRQISWVGGLGVPACKILEASRIESAKVIPWEWSQPQLLSEYPSKTLREDNLVVSLIYVGPLDSKAGIHDLLQATLQLQKFGHTVHLQLIRNTLNDTSPVEAEETIWLEQQVQNLALTPAVKILAGLAPEQMLERVREADIAVLPQPGSASPRYHPELPLGLALAMAARTPIVACDHDDLAMHLYHGANAITFPMGSSESMAHRIERIMGQPSLYAQLSESSQITLDTIKVPARWAALIDLWMSDSAYDRQHLRDYALSSGRYDLPVPKREPLSKVL